MRFRFLSVLAASTVLVLVGVASASAGGATRTASARGQAKVGPWVPNITILWNQIGSPGANGITSQNFETANDALDNSGADDFVIPAGKRWRIQGMRAVGFYSASGPCTSETVTFYRNNGPGGRPGTPVAMRTGVGSDAGGVITLLFSSPVTITIAGTYWVGFVCNMNLTPNGQWFWSTTTVLKGMVAQWQNPLNGFGTGCTTWSDMNPCVGITGQPDFQYALAGAAM